MCRLFNPLFATAKTKGVLVSKLFTGEFETKSIHVLADKFIRGVEFLKLLSIAVGHIGVEFFGELKVTLSYHLFVFDSN